MISIGVRNKVAKNIPKSIPSSGECYTKALLRLVSVQTPHAGANPKLTGTCGVVQAVGPHRLQTRSDDDDVTIKKAMQHRKHEKLPL